MSSFYEQAVWFHSTILQSAAAILALLTTAFFALHTYKTSKEEELIKDIEDDSWIRFGNIIERRKLAKRSFQRINKWLKRHKKEYGEASSRNSERIERELKNPTHMFTKNESKDLRFIAKYNRNKELRVSYDGLIRLYSLRIDIRRPIYCAAFSCLISIFSLWKLLSLDEATLTVLYLASGVPFLLSIVLVIILINKLFKFKVGTEYMTLPTD